MTYNEIISQLSNEFALSHADSRTTNKFWYSLIQKHTAWIVKQESDKMFLFHADSIWQTLNCVDLIEVPTTDDCCKYSGPSCKIYRTKDKIPKLYEDVFGVIIKNVNSIDYSKNNENKSLPDPFREVKSLFFDLHVFLFISQNLLIISFAPQNSLVVVQVVVLGSDDLVVLVKF